MNIAARIWLAVYQDSAESRKKNVLAASLLSVVIVQAVMAPPQDMSMAAWRATAGDV